LRYSIHHRDTLSDFLISIVEMTVRCVWTDPFCYMCYLFCSWSYDHVL